MCCNAASKFVIVIEKYRKRKQNVIFNDARRLRLENKSKQFNLCLSVCLVWVLVSISFSCQSLLTGAADRVFFLFLFCFLLLLLLLLPGRFLIESVLWECESDSSALHFSIKTRNSSIGFDNATQLRIPEFTRNAQISGTELLTK